MVRRKFRLNEGLKHVKLIPVRVGHDDPRDGALANADSSGAERL